MGKREKAELQIFDIDGNVVQSVYVDDPENGLRGADFGGLDATYGQMQGLDLSGANLYWATLRNADLRLAILSEADLRGAILEKANCSGANFRDANLGLDNLGGRTNLRGTNLGTANLEGANLSGAIYDDETCFPSGFSPSERGMIHVDELDKK